MAKQLIFEVVDSRPTSPYTAQWDGSQWVICDANGATWFFPGSQSDAAEQLSAVQSGAQSDLLKALAITQHESAALAYIKGGNND